MKNIFAKSNEGSITKYQLAFNYLLRNENCNYYYEDVKVGVKAIYKDVRKGNIIFDEGDKRFIDRLDFMKRIFPKSREYLYSALMAVISILAILSGSQFMLFISSISLSFHVIFMFKDMMKFGLGLDNIHLLREMKPVKPRILFLLLAIPAIVSSFKLTIPLMVIQFAITMFLTIGISIANIRYYNKLIIEFEEQFKETLYYDIESNNVIRIVSAFDDEYGKIRNDLTSNKKMLGLIKGGLHSE